MIIESLSFWNEYNPSTHYNELFPFPCFDLMFFEVFFKENYKNGNFYKKLCFY